MFVKSTQKNALKQQLIPMVVMASASISTFALAEPATSEEPSTAISGRVWLDKNEDGIQDGDEAGERGFYQAPVDLLDDQGQVLQTVKTLASGYYEFTDIAPGNYQVQFYYPPECRFTTQNVNGNDGTDSDADAETGIADNIVINEYTPLQLEVDAGVSCGPVQARTQAENDAVTGYVDETLVVNVLDNDQLPSAVTDLKIIANPSGLSADFNDDHQLVIDGIAEPGEYVLEYQVDCSTGDGSTATVIITINPANPTEPAEPSNPAEPSDPIIDETPENNCPDVDLIKREKIRGRKMFNRYLNKKRALQYKKISQFKAKKYGSKKKSLMTAGFKRDGARKVSASKIRQSQSRVRRSFTSRNWRC